MTPNPVARLVLASLLLVLASYRGLPVFRSYCGVAAVLTALYLPYNTPWLIRWYPLVSCSLVLGRAVVAAEALYWIHEDREYRITAFGSAGVAVGAVIAACNYQGFKLAPWVELRNYVQIGTAMFLLLPLMVSWKFGAGNLGHAWITLVYLSGYAGISMASTAWQKFGEWWPYFDLAGYGVAIGCCVAWLIRARRAFSFQVGYAIPKSPQGLFNKS